MGKGTEDSYRRWNPTILDSRVEVPHPVPGRRGVQANIASSSRKRIGRQLVMSLSSGSNNDPHNRNLTWGKVITAEIKVAQKAGKQQGMANSGENYTEYVLSDIPGKPGNDLRAACLHVRKLVETLRVPGVAQQEQIHQSHGCDVQGCSVLTTGLESCLPQRDWGATNVTLGTTAARRLVSKWAKRKYVRTAPINVIPFASEVQIVSGTCKKNANHATDAVATMRTRLTVFLATSAINGSQIRQVHHNKPGRHRSVGTWNPTINYKLSGDFGAANRSA